MRTRAAVLTAPGLENLCLTELTLDDPQPNEVLVRVAAAGLCHSDLHFIDGTLPLASPRILGHEVSGIVTKVGSQVTSVRPGEHVVACFTMPCGSCRTCVDGHGNLCDRRSKQWRREAGAPPRNTDRAGNEVEAGSGIGGIAEHVLVHESGLVAIDEAMPLVPAALLGCAIVTGTGAVFNTARVRPGESVVVIGCGGVGLSIIQGARISGAGRVVAVDRNVDKLTIARRFGATDVINPDDHSDYVEVVRGQCGGGGVDHAFEAIGNSRCCAEAVRMLAPRGTATIVGIFPDGVDIAVPARLMLTRELRIQGSYMGSTSFRRDIPMLVDLYLSGRLLLDEMVDPRLTLDEVRDGFDRMMKGNVVRPVIDFAAGDE